jgi:hypothetical protein
MCAWWQPSTGESDVATVRRVTPGRVGPNDAEMADYPEARVQDTALAGHRGSTYR